MSALFDKAMEFIWNPQRDGHQDDTGPGETFRTSWGVTQRTWDDAVKSGLVHGRLENATQAQAKIIYLRRYWMPLKCDLLPVPVALAAFADATLVGVGEVSHLIQRFVGVKQDGIIGPMTLNAVSGWNPLVLALMIVGANLEYMGGLNNAKEYLGGWTTRQRELGDMILALDG